MGEETIIYQHVDLLGNTLLLGWASDFYPFRAIARWVIKMRSSEERINKALDTFCADESAQKILKGMVNM